MLTIFVLEDSLEQQFRIESIIKHIISTNDIKLKQLRLFDDSKQLLEQITEQGSHQIFLLDIQIGNNNREGLDLARKIRLKDPYATIIFTTLHTEYLLLTYEYRISALDFIDKMLPDKEYERRIELAIFDAIKKCDKNVIEDAFYFETPLSAIQVPFDKILFFETSSTVHKVILHTKDGRSEFYGPLSKIEKVDSRLYRCHKSFVVNYENIVSIDKKTGKVNFENDVFCFASKLKINTLISKIHNDS